MRQAQCLMAFLLGALAALSCYCVPVAANGRALAGAGAVKTWPNPVFAPNLRFPYRTCDTSAPSAYSLDLDHVETPSRGAASLCFTLTTTTVKDSSHCANKDLGKIQLLWIPDGQILPAGTGTFGSDKVKVAYTPHADPTGRHTGVFTIERYDGKPLGKHYKLTGKSVPLCINFNMGAVGSFGRVSRPHSLRMLRALPGQVTAAGAAPQPDVAFVGTLGQCCPLGVMKGSTSE